MSALVSVRVWHVLHPPTLTLESLLAEAPVETKSRLNTPPVTHTHARTRTKQVPHWIQLVRLVVEIHPH